MILKMKHIIAIVLYTDVIVTISYDQKPQDVCDDNQCICSLNK